MLSSDREILTGIIDLLNDNIKQQHDFQTYVIGRFDSLDKRVERIETRLDSLDNRVEHIEVRLDNLEQEQKNMRAEIQQLHDESIRTSSRLNSLETYGGWLIGAITLIAALMTIFIPALTAIFSRRNNKSESVPSSAPAPVFYIRPADFVIAKEDAKS